VTLAEALRALPHCPNDEFPGTKGYEDRVPLVADLRILSCFEFGGHFGFGLVTWLHTFPEITWAGWCDNERAFTGSNLACGENVRAYLGERRVQLWWCEVPTEALGRKADLVMVDGDHGYGSCLIDLTLALSMKPKVILVDDLQLGGVDQAVRDFSAYSGLRFDSYPVAAGTAVFRLEV